MRQALTIVLCLPDRVGHAPEAGEHEEHGQLAGVRLPQQEGNDAGQLGHGPWGWGRGTGGSSETLGATGRASDPLLPRLLLPAFSGAFDLTRAGCQGASLAGVGLCLPLASTGAMAGEPWGDAPLLLRAKCHLAGQRRAQIVGAQGGRHWASSLVGIPASLTEWGGMGRGGEEGPPAWERGLPSRMGSRGWGQGLLAPPGFVLTARGLGFVSLQAL